MPQTVLHGQNYQYNGHNGHLPIHNPQQNGHVNYIIHNGHGPYYMQNGHSKTNGHLGENIFILFISSNGCQNQKCILHKYVFRTTPPYR